jgi:hypothetical protein
VALSLIIAGETDYMDGAEHEQGTVIFIFGNIYTISKP